MGAIAAIINNFVNAINSMHIINEKTLRED